MADFLGMMARREGVGAVFADGILRAEQEFGLEGVAVHVKGMEPAGYDPRRSKGMGLGYIMTERGACHLRATFMKAELVGLIDINATKGKAALYVDWEDRFAIMDSLVYCRFYRDLVDWDFITKVVNASAGTDHSVEKMKEIGGRIITETHEFNHRRGFGAEKEKLPAWITQRPLIAKDGEELRITDDDLALMRREYYDARGWGEPPG